MKTKKLAALAVTTSLLLTGAAFANNDQTYNTTLNLVGAGLNFGVMASSDEVNPAEAFAGTVELLSAMSKVPGFEFLDAITPGEGPSIADVMEQLQQIEEQLQNIQLTLDDIQQDVKNLNYNVEYNEFNRNFQHIKTDQSNINNVYSTLTTTIGSMGAQSLSELLKNPTENQLLQLSSSLSNMSLNSFNTAIEDMSDSDNNYIECMITALQNMFIQQFNDLEAGENAVTLFGQYNRLVSGIYTQLLISLQKGLIVKEAIVNINIAITEYNQKNPTKFIPTIDSPDLQATANGVDFYKEQLKKIDTYFTDRTNDLKAYFTQPYNPQSPNIIPKTQDVMIPNIDFKITNQVGNQSMYYRSTYDPTATSGPAAANGEIYLASIKGYKDYGNTMWDLVIDNKGTESSAHWIYGGTNLPTQVTPSITNFAEGHGPVLQTIMNNNAMAENYLTMGLWKRDENSKDFLYTSRDAEGNWISFGKCSSSVWVNHQFGKGFAAPDANGNPTSYMLPAEANMLSLAPLVYMNSGAIGTPLPSFTGKDLIHRYLNIFNPLNVMPSNDSALNQQTNAVTYSTLHLNLNTMTQPLNVIYNNNPNRAPIYNNKSELFLVQGGMELIPNSSDWDYVGNMFKETYIPRLIINHSNGMISNSIASASPQNVLWYLTGQNADEATKGSYFQMQTDGNLVLYAKDKTPLWSSAAAAGYNSGQPGVLAIQPDGNVVVYHNYGSENNPNLTNPQTNMPLPLWASGAQCTDGSCTLSPANN